MFYGGEIMNNKFFVINARRLLMIVVIISILTILSISGSTIVNNVIETSTSSKLLPIYSVEKVDKVVALTFDCAWGADDIPSIIETLEANDVYATFFTVGDWIRKYPNAVKQLSDAEMTVANHSWNHAHVNKLSYEENVADMKKCNEKIEEITGEKVQFYRGPYGEYNNTVIKAAESLGMKVIQWDVDTLDYEGKRPDEMCSRIKKKMRNGSIILMHNDTKHTAEGLQQIIDCIRSEGYEIVSLNELVYENGYDINHEGRQIKK